ncbi:MAG: gamma-glutamyl-gamma-aminobutyrate hydrolase family protein, partial [Acidimicrobiia bacterium]
EIGLAHEARDRGLPLLAICRGIQVVNVALGGDLILDISSEVGDGVAHRETTGESVAGHHIRLLPDSRLAGLFGATRVPVNSSHHQAVRSLGAGLRPVAWAEDEVIEAVEPEDDGWPLWGVQWHPEYPEPEQMTAERLFGALVDEAAHKLSLGTV